MFCARGRGGRPPTHLVRIYFYKLVKLGPFIISVSGLIEDM